MPLYRVYIDATFGEHYDIDAPTEEAAQEIGYRYARADYPSASQIEVSSDWIEGDEDAAEEGE